MLVLQVVELPVMHFLMENDLEAAGGERKRALNQYEKVKIGGSEYTYLGNNKYLLNDSLGVNLWGIAVDLAVAYKNSDNFLIKERNSILNTRLAANSDLSINHDNEAVPSLIPAISDSWWLSSQNTDSSHRDYIDNRNIFNAGHNEYFQNFQENACVEEMRFHEGGLPIENITISAEPPRSTSITAYETSITWMSGVSGSPRTYDLEGNELSRMGFGVSAGQRSTVYTTAPISGTVNWYNKYIIIPDAGKYKYIKYYLESGAYQSTTNGASKQVTLNAGLKSPCADTVLPPSTASVRPVLELDSITVFSMYTRKDDNTGHVLAAYPDAGDGPYTIQTEDNQLILGLDSSDSTVKNSHEIEVNLSTVRESNGVISIPYDTSGSTYDSGTPYISAMTDDNHYKKLSTATANGSGIATLNINNIATIEEGKIVPQTISLNLYLEEITADGHMDYISVPLSVSVNIIDDRITQIIEQETDDPVSLTYGTSSDLHFTAKGSADNPTSVSDTPITFSLSTEDQAYAQLTDYGNGVVEVKPLKAGKTINVLVDKAGDTEHKDAPQLKVPIELHKKSITIRAESFTKEIGEDEPSYTVTAGEDDLVSGDAIPSGIKAVTAYTSTDGKLMTETTGTDITVEEDDSAEVQAFKEKYDITYINGKLIVGRTSADETWLAIAPAPDANGWNTTDVIIAPSAIAEASGYTKIALNGGTQDTQIVISTSTSTENMKFILYKENGSLTSEITLSKDIKIDKEAPITTVTGVEDEDTWATQKKVAFNVTETGSGIRSITVTKPDGTNAEVTGILTGTSFSFIADQAGDYTIDVADNAGNEAVQITKAVGKIELTKLNITDISNDGSAEEHPWESVERIVTFQITVGESGLKAGMPQVMMGADSLAVTDEGNGNYSFTATKNGAYKIIAESNAGDKKEITGTIAKIDKTAPAVTIDVEKIPETFSMKLLNALTGGAFYKGGFIVTVTATDEESGIDTITSPNGTGSITTNGNTRTLTFTVSEDFKGTITATATNMAGLDTSETTQTVINENTNQTASIQPTGISGHINADDVFEAKLKADVSANQSGLKEISYIIDDAETSLKSYTAADAESGSLTLTDSIIIPLTTIIQNAPADQDELTVTIKVTTNSGNTLTKDVTIQYDINASTIAIISVEKEHVWAYQKQVDFSVNEEGSGIDSITVLKPDGTQADVNGELTGDTFDFIADQNGTYTIDVDDIAGNQALQISKNITKIDRDLPLITDVRITPENDTWADKKTVAFHVKDLVDADNGSGVDQSGIKVTASTGSESIVTCTGNSDDLTCSFDVTAEDTYTIKAKDHAGNDAAEKDVEVKNIDSAGVDITDIKNDGSDMDDPWVQENRIVTFRITVGQSGLKPDMPQVTMGSDSLAVTDEGNGNYSFTATKNGAYTIIAESETGDKKEITGTISKIDNTAPVITDLKVEQERDLTVHDARVTVSFKASDAASGITEVSYQIDGTSIILTPDNGSYRFVTSKNGTYTITVTDAAGNCETETVTISIPTIDEELIDLTVYEKDELNISLSTDMNDMVKTGRTYEWFYIDEEGVETSIRTGTLRDEDKVQMIPFPYTEAAAEHSGRYHCLIRNGDGFYTWSAAFKLTVLSDPVTGLVMIPSEIEMKNMDDGSETAQAVFDIELEDSIIGSSIPAKKFHIETMKELLLKAANTEDSYKAKVYKETGGRYVPYESGDIAELEYSGTKKQKVKLMMPVNEAHRQGTYQGILKFIIRYGEGGTGA